MELQRLQPLVRDQLIRIHLILDMDNKIGLTDANKFLEDVFKLPLGLIDDCEYLNLNVEEHISYPGVDLGDSAKKQYFQVTSRTDQTKINDACKAFTKRLKEEGLDGTRRIRFLFLKVDTPRKSAYVCPADIDSEVLTFDPTKDVLNLTDLLAVVFSKDLEMITTIHEHLKKHLSDGANLPYVDTDAELLRLFFVTLADVVLTEDVDNVASKTFGSDHKLKKELLGDFWDYVLKMHQNIEVRQSQRFETVSSQMSEGQRLGIKNFLEHNSLKLLAKTNNPEKALDELKTLITSKVRPFPFSETEVEQFLLQQLIFCDVFPVMEKV